MSRPIDQIRREQALVSARVEFFAQKVREFQEEHAKALGEFRCIDSELREALEEYRETRDPAYTSRKNPGELGSYHREIELGRPPGM
jgi:hypothetical protein